MRKGVELFVIVPLSHESGALGVPWATAGILGSCMVAFAVAHSAQGTALSRLEAAWNEVEATAATDPEARVAASVAARLPQGLRDRLGPLVVDDDVLNAGDQGAYPGLTRAVEQAAEAIESLPSVRFGYVPARPRLAAAVTSMFMHGDLLHLIGNLLFLWVAGAAMEALWRRWRFAALYLATGLLAVLAHHVSNAQSGVPLVGASGAIAGLMGALLVAQPRASVRMGYFVYLPSRPIAGSFNVPAWVVLPLWFALQVVYAATDEAGGVAYGAHIGGFAAGALGALAAVKLRWIDPAAEAQRIQREQAAGARAPAIRRRGEAIRIEPDTRGQGPRR